jgi:hypothetical protein
VLSEGFSPQRLFPLTRLIRLFYLHVLSEGFRPQRPGSIARMTAHTHQQKHETREQASCLQAVPERASDQDGMRASAVR